VVAKSEFGGGIGVSPAENIEVDVAVVDMLNGAKRCKGV